MKEELELRILDVDVNKVIDKLEKMGAEKVGDWHYIRYIYDTKPFDDDKWIRLRSNGEEITLTYKNFANDSIDGVKELEIGVSDLQKTKEFLEILGYEHISFQENKRIRYMYNDIEIDIDTWPYLNAYVEVEANSKDKVIEIVDELKVYGSEVTAKNVQSIYLEKGYTKEDLNDLHF